MEGVLTEQASGSLHHDIDYDNTEFDIGREAGDDLEFDVGDGNIVKEGQLEGALGPASADTSADHNTTISDNVPGIHQQDIPADGLAAAEDAGEDEIDYDHDDIGESFGGIGTSTGDSLQQDAGLVDHEDEEYGEIDYQGDDGANTNQHGDLEAGNTDDNHPSSEGLEAQQLAQKATEESDTVASGFLEGEGITASDVPQDYAEDLETSISGQDAHGIPQPDILEGNVQLEHGVLAAELEGAHPEGTESNDGDGQYDESAYSMEDAGGYESHDFTTTQPDVTFCYRHDEYSLFAESPDDDPNTYFLADTEAINLPLCDFLTKIRGIIAGEVSSGEEIVLRVDGLGLEFGETTTKEFLEQTTFGQIIELHDRLVKLDDANASRNLYVYLITRSNCLHRFSELSHGVSSGRGLSAFERYFDAPSPVDDTRGDESNDLSQVDEVFVDSVDDNHLNSTDAAGEDVHVDQLTEGMSGVDAEQSGLDGVAAHVEYAAEEVVQITQTDSFEDYQDSHQEETGTFFDDAAGDGQLDHSEADLSQASNEQGHDQIAEVGSEALWPGGAEIGFDNNDVAYHHHDQPGDGQATTVFEEEQLLDYDEDEEFDEPADVQDANPSDHAVHDPQHDAASTTIDQSSHEQHEIDYAAPETDELSDQAGAAESTTVPSNFQNTAKQDTSLDPAQSGTPRPVSDNTSASNTLNGDDIDFDDDMAQPPVQESIINVSASIESEADEIDWDHNEDDVVDTNDTNLELSSNSGKRSRQSDADVGPDDENAVKRRRT